MKISKFKNLSINELMDKLKVDVKAYELKKINHSVSPLNNTAVITYLRKEIARMKTEIHQRNINNEIK